MRPGWLISSVFRRVGILAIIFPLVASVESLAQERAVVTLGFAPVESVAERAVEPSDTTYLPGPLRERVIGLGESLRLAGSDNPRIAIAEEAVRAGEAERTLARAMLLPNLDAGVNYRAHRGPLLNSLGLVREVDLQSLYYGFGADAKGAGTVAVPGIRLTAHLGDALFASRAAEYLVSGRRLDAEATRNVILQEVATRYLNLAAAQARIQVIEQSLQELGAIERLTGDQARAGQGRDSDAQRASSETSLLRASAERAIEDRDVASAELARYLTLDPVIRLRASDETPPLLELIDPRTPMSHLLETAVRRHPEIAARGADIGLNTARWRQERVRPWIPVLMVGFSAGEFGGGSDLVRPRFGDFNSRTDFDVLAVWTVQNLGFGNRARRETARAQIGQAEAARTRVLDRVRAEVTEAVTVALMRRSEMEVVRARLVAAGDAYRHDLLRSRNLQGRPIEVLNSATMLAAARQDYVQSRLAYSVAQVRLLVALGESPPP